MPLSQIQLVPSRDTDVTWPDPAPEIKEKFSRATNLYQEWFQLKDTDLGPFKICCGAIAANAYDADPIWVMLVGGSSSGKSETLRALSRIPNLRELSVTTVPGLLSGTKREERAQDARGGLLVEIGDQPGVIVIKDWGSVLSLDRHVRPEFLQALREIYDGSWSRWVGAEGGRELRWSGKISLLCGATGAIDVHHGAAAELGERFVYYRMPENKTTQDRDKLARSAIHNVGAVKAMRNQLLEALSDLFTPPPPVPEVSEFISPGREEQLIALANITTLGRSAVIRDSYSRNEILHTPPAEAPTRFAGQLTVLLGGMAAIGVAEKEAWSILRKAALDSLPPLRAGIMERMQRQPQGTGMSRAEIARAMRAAETTAGRSLEDLRLLGILDWGPGNGESTLSAMARKLLEKAGL